MSAGPPGISVMGQKGEPGMDSRSPFYGDLTHSAGRVGKLFINWNDFIWLSEFHTIIGTNEIHIQT